MQISVTFEDGDVNKFLTAAPKDIQKAIRNIVKKVSLLVERNAKFYTPVDTGLLRASIATDFRDTLTETYATIEPHTNYAEYVHNIVPFMTTGAIQAEQQVDSIIDAEIRKTVLHNV